MTDELFDRAKELRHDIEMLDAIKGEQDLYHWVELSTPNTIKDQFVSVEVLNDFRKFIAEELIKVQLLFDEL